jgi:glyoxylase-like metal-dependent hydrolase (beta-lactamase superfamily II)
LPLGSPSAALLNISKEKIARQLHDNFLPAKSAVLQQNVLVANLGDRVVLFDTGMGTDALFGASTGKRIGTLKQAGIDPAGVDAVVMSHARIDYCGGLIADDGPLRNLLHVC